MPPKPITLENAPEVLILPLYFLSMFRQLVICFAVTEYQHYEGKREYRRICCLRPDTTMFEPRQKRPVLFELVGQIARENCYLTARGGEEHQEPDDPVASCWVTARPDIISRTYWRSILPTIQEVVDTIPGGVDTSRLVCGRADDIASVRVQVLWRAPDGESIAQSLPMYRSNGTRYVPATLEEVPFGRALRFVFTLEYYHERDNPDTRLMYAYIVHIVHV